jgi:membrane-bound lytic murein transglycosylase D
MLGASNFYTPLFEEALEMYQLPLELKYLPVIESALNPNAVSRVGATGLWQFMITTGRQYGLKVNSLVDERRDPVKASYAAAQYLRDLYKIFGDWNLVIAAYNCGPSNINKAIHRANGEKDYWRIYPYLPKETRGYVPAFIAANYIMTYYSQHNICPMTTRLPAKSDTVMVNREMHLEQVAAVVGINIDLLRSLNPMYRRDVVPGNTEPMPLRLPQGDVSRFIDLEDSVYNYKTDELLTHRTEVEVNDDVPTYYHKSKRSYKKGKRGSRASKRRATRASKKRATSSKRRSKGRRSRRRR